MAHGHVDAASAEDDGKIRGVEIDSVKYSSQLVLAAQKGFWFGAVATPVASVYKGYRAARLEYPYPQHVPAQVAWNNAAKNITRFAAPVIGVTTIFHVALGYHQSRYPMKNRWEIMPGLFAVGVAGVPFAVSLVMKKHVPMLGTAVSLCCFEYLRERWSATPFHAFPQP